MKYTSNETAQAVTLEPAGGAVASVIWLHGLGADGNDFVPLIPELRLPDTPGVRFVFPHAAVRPVTINSGHRMRAWYDIRGFAPESSEDEEGIRASARLVDDYIAHEVQAGIATRRIVLAGFSQGGVIALHAGLRQPQRLAGVLALSTYLGLRRTLAAEIAPANAELPILMCHGTQDGVIAIERARESCELLRAAGAHVDFREFPMQHSLCAQEINLVSEWLQSRLAQPGSGGDASRAGVHRSW